MLKPPEGSGPEVPQVHDHTIKLDMASGTFLSIVCLIVFLNIGWFLRLGMLPTGTFSSPVSALSVV